MRMRKSEPGLAWARATPGPEWASVMVARAQEQVLARVEPAPEWEPVLAETAPVAAGRALGPTAAELPRALGSAAARLERALASELRAQAAAQRELASAPAVLVQAVLVQAVLAAIRETAREAVAADPASVDSVD